MQVLFRGPFNSAVGKRLVSEKIIGFCTGLIQVRDDVDDGSGRKSSKNRIVLDPKTGRPVDSENEDLGFSVRYKLDGEQFEHWFAHSKLEFTKLTMERVEAVHLAVLEKRRNSAGGGGTGRKRSFSDA